MLRKLAISLLNQDCGINEESYRILRDMMYEQLSYEEATSIIYCVKATEGAYYLPLDFDADTV